MSESDDDELLRAFSQLLGRPLKTDDLECPLTHLFPGALARTSIRFLLENAGALNAMDYVHDGSTLAELFHFVELSSTNAANSTDRPRRRRMVALRPLQDSDIPGLYRAATQPESAFRWRFRGSTPSPSDFLNSLWSGVLAQYVVEGTSDGEQYGLVTAYNAQLEQGHTYLALYRTSERRGNGQMIRGMALFIDHLFATFPLRKIYAEVPEYNELVLGLEHLDLCRLEGRLTEHHYHAGRWWDHLIFAIRRQEWEMFSAAVIAPFSPPP